MEMLLLILALGVKWATAFQLASSRVRIPTIIPTMLFSEDSNSFRSRFTEALKRQEDEAPPTPPFPVFPTEVQVTPPLSASPTGLPARDKSGIYLVKTREHHSALLKANPDKLVVMKFTAGYCQACAALGPKFTAVARDQRLANLPIVWADFKASPDNKPFFRRLGVLSLPTVHFYDGPRGLIENFPCGPTRIPTLTRKLDRFLNNRVDPMTKQLRPVSPSTVAADAPRMVREVKIGDELITDEHLDYLRDGMPFFEDLTDAEFDEMLSKASLQTFLPGDIVIRQGLPPQKFFVVKSGVMEMCVKSRFADPISTPPSYLGPVVNDLKKFDFFGERALSTGEPYAASVRCLEKSRCFVFPENIIPESSILSRKRRITQSMVDQLNARYELPEDYHPTYFYTEKDSSILDLLLRFRQIRQVAKCFEYVMSSNALLGDKGEIARRSLLISKLSKSQREDFVEVFNLIDVHRSGTISLLDMRRLMEIARKDLPENELLGMLEKANPLVEGFKFGVGITLDEFMGVMAEAEFFSLFTETFQALDKDNTGYVRAGDLDEALVRTTFVSSMPRRYTFFLTFML